MHIARIRKLKGELACDLSAGDADAAGAAGAPPAPHTEVKRLSLDDPIYISSPSHEAIGRAPEFPARVLVVLTVRDGWSRLLCVVLITSVSRRQGAGD
jgi:hypothetical protein